MKAPLCLRCERVSHWHKQPTGRGWRILPWCLRCDRHPTGSSRPPKGHKTFYANSLFSAFTIRSMRIRGVHEGHCEVCGTLGPVEVHHLAPRALFGDAANLWPVIDLCTTCHDEWHSKVWSA